MNEIIHNTSSQKTTYFLASMIPSFIAQADVAPTSRQTYRRCLQRFFEWALEEHGNESYLKREHIVSYKNFLDYSGLRPFTRAAYLVAVRRFFEWTESALLYPNIAKSIKGIRRSSRSHHKDSLQPSAISQLLHSFAPDTLTNKRDYALIFLLLHTGLRLIEVSRALISDIEVRSDQALLWIRGKGCEGKDSFVVIHAEAFSYILSFLQERKVTLGSRKPLFVSFSDRSYNKSLSTPSLSRIIKNRMIAAGIKTPRITAHSLRHTFGVLAIKSGASLYDVQLAMRHLSPATTQVYLGDIEKEKRMEGLPEQGVGKLIKKSLTKE